MDGLKDGWYDLEHDGVRNFRWSSESSLVSLSSEENTLKLFMGTDNPNRIISFVYNDGKTYKIPAKAGWV